MEYSITKRTNNLELYAALSINLISIMLKERSQTQKSTYCVTPFTESDSIHRIHRWTKLIHAV